MSVWYCIPSKRPPDEAEKALKLWRERGYKVAIQRDEEESPGAEWRGEPWNDTLVHWRPYRGYAEAVNFLVADVLTYDPACQWVVTGGDDVHPDLNHTADEIAHQCSEHFQAVSSARELDPIGSKHGNHIAQPTFGVMQPVGDRWGADEPYSQAKWPDAPAMIDRICGSPWMGRSFCERINQGQGPLWAEYHHNWVDEELQNVAIKYGCFWQRRDLIHYHDHCRRNGGPWAPHLKGADADYVRMKPLFETRKRMNFPGSEPL